MLWRLQVVDVMQDSRQKMDRLMQILRREEPSIRSRNHCLTAALMTQVLVI